MAVAAIIRYTQSLRFNSNWIPIVFVAVINLLTLVAFSVHAVFGCCLHHHHHPHSESCMSVHDSDKSGRDCDAKADSKGDQVGCCHHQHGNLDEEINDSHETESEPYDGSNNCKEPRCNFIASSPKTLDVLGSISTIVAYVGNQLTVCQFSVSTSSSFLCQFESASPSGGARIYCALMQSWQI